MKNNILQNIKDDLDISSKFFLKLMEITLTK